MSDPRIDALRDMLDVAQGMLGEIRDALADLPTYESSDTTVLQGGPAPAMPGERPQWKGQLPHPETQKTEAQRPDTAAGEGITEGQVRAVGFLGKQKLRLSILDDPRVGLLDWTKDEASEYINALQRQVDGKGKAELPLSVRQRLAQLKNPGVVGEIRALAETIASNVEAKSADEVISGALFELGVSGDAALEEIEPDLQGEVLRWMRNFESLVR